MRVLTDRQVENIITILTGMQMELVVNKEIIHPEIYKNLTAAIMDAVEKTGGNAGKGQYAQQIMDYFLGGVINDKERKIADETHQDNHER